MTDREIFQLWQDNIQKKVAEIDRAIEILIQLRDSYTLASWSGGLKKREEFVPDTWNDR